MHQSVPAFYDATLVLQAAMIAHTSMDSLNLMALTLMHIPGFNHGTKSIFFHPVPTVEAAHA